MILSNKKQLIKFTTKNYRGMVLIKTTTFAKVVKTVEVKKI